MDPEEVLLGSQRLAASRDERAAEAEAREGIAWWNDLREESRGVWLRLANSAVPADAWNEYKRRRSRVIEAFDALIGDEMRADVFAELRGLWCEHCGRPQPLHGHCHCMNDE